MTGQLTNQRHHQRQRQPRLRQRQRLGRRRRGRERAAHRRHRDGRIHGAGERGRQRAAATRSRSACRPPQNSGLPERADLHGRPVLAVQLHPLHHHRAMQRRARADVQGARRIAFGNVCADASNQCTAVPTTYEETECKGTQNSGTCDDCGGGGGGGICQRARRVASINPLRDLRRDAAPTAACCPICAGEAGGGAGRAPDRRRLRGRDLRRLGQRLQRRRRRQPPPLNCNGTHDALVRAAASRRPARPNTPVVHRPGDRHAPALPRGPRHVGLDADRLHGQPTFGDGSVDHPGVDTSATRTIGKQQLSHLHRARRARRRARGLHGRPTSRWRAITRTSASDRSCQTASWFECQKICCSYDDPTQQHDPELPHRAGVQHGADDLRGRRTPRRSTPTSTSAGRTRRDCINYAGSCGAAAARRRRARGLRQAAPAAR